MVFPHTMAHDPADLSNDDDKPLPRLQGVFLRLQRNLWLFGLVGASFIAGKPVTRLLESYRGVILEAKDGEMYLAFADRVPRWVPQANDPNAQPGAVIAKEIGTWAAAPVEARGRDLPLVQMYGRYAATYDAVIVRIDPPLSPGLAATAVIDTDAGKRLRIPLGAEGLATAAAGRRLRKLPSSWDPILLDDAGEVGDQAAVPR